MAIAFNISDFRLVLNIVEAASLTKGAEKSFLSLPAASQRVKNLEDSLNLKLFQRKAQGVTPTEAGLAYVKHARLLLSQLDLLTSDLQAFNEGIKGQVRLHANTTWVTELLPTVLGEFLQGHPEIRVDLNERLSDSIVRAVREGIADVGLIAGEVESEGVQAWHVTSSKMVVIAKKGHPILAAPKVYFKDTLQYEFVSLLEGTAWHNYIYSMASSLHLPPIVRVKVASYDAIWRMVEAGAGISVIPHVVVERLVASGLIGYTELLDPWAVREYKVCARDFDELPTFSRQFVDALLEHYRRDDASK